MTLARHSPFEGPPKGGTPNAKPRQRGLGMLGVPPLGGREPGERGTPRSGNRLKVELQTQRRVGAVWGCSEFRL